MSECDGVKIRLHRVALSNSIYRADDGVLVGQHAFGVAAGRAPILQLHGTGSGDMVSAYLESFNRIWADAPPLTES